MHDRIRVNLCLSWVSSGNECKCKMLFKQIFGVKAGLQCVREIIFLCFCAGVRCSATVADPSHAFLADLSPLVAQTKYRRRERTKTQTKPNRFITILSLRFKSRHGNILCHATPVMYLWWAVSRHNECESSEQTFRHDRRTTALPYTCWRQQRTSHFHFPYPFLLPHRGNGFSDLCLPITVRFTQHQPSDSITHQHTSHIMNTPAPLPIAWFPPHQLVTAGVCRMIEMTGALFEIAMMTLMMT